MGRAAQVQREIEFVRAREAEYHVMVDLLAAGKLPLRVTHNDTKLNNILFDKTTGEGLCVIDLDTVMPGLAANDFGDSIRFGANHCAEDEADLSKVNFSMELFEIYTKGFLQAAGETFTPLEKQTLPWGAKRFVDFQRAVAEDRMGRAAQVQREIEFVRAREAEYHVMVDLLAAGKLPLRVTHNDTKLNNILFDKTTGEGLCVIDLDTVMPGLAANDFGDSIRFGANHCAEDEADLSKVNFSMELFEIYTKGFLQAAGETFTPLEKQTLPWGAKLMTMECGMRFLADYLEGDHYFHINYETQNLNRARTQFKLTADMERNWDAMQKVIEKYC